MAALSFDLLCNSMILISPINWKVEIMVIYLALVRSVPITLSLLFLQMLVMRNQMPETTGFGGWG